MYKFELLQEVIKTGGDYAFPGVVVARYKNGLGKIRYVVEARNFHNPAGPFQYMAHIFSEDQLEPL